MKKQTKQSKQTKSEELQKFAKCKNIHSGPMSNAAWSDFKRKGDILKKHDLCGKDGCNCQKNDMFYSQKVRS